MRSPDTDRMIIALAEARAKELGVKLREGHEVRIFDAPGLDQLRMAKRVACRCGWKKLITDMEMLTTAADVFLDALTEHALAQTDPTHYTYYPRHAEHGRNN